MRTGPQNLKALGLQVFFLICCSTFSFLSNVGLRLTLEYLTCFLHDKSLQWICRVAFGLGFVVVILRSDKSIGQQKKKTFILLAVKEVGNIENTELI